MCFSKKFYKVTCLSIAVLVSANVYANTQNIPEPFRGQDKNSTISINYDDISNILQLSVLDMGKSKRATAPKNTAQIGTRYKNKRKKVYTALEGNRFLFKNFTTDRNRKILTNIRTSLEKVPDEVLMSQLNSREQLAYWLNLYNISLIEQIVAIYPKRNLEHELYGKNGIMDNKFLKVSGIELSLNDIHEKIILGKFSANPIVIYGLFQGTIGGPNIRSMAYTGKSVIKQLRQNATEFINSNRGLFADKKGRLRVSSFYELNRDFFPDFESDLKKHIRPYIDDNYINYFEQADNIKANIKDMGIVDLEGGQRRISSSAANNKAAFLGSAKAEGMINVAGPGGGFVNPSTGLTSEFYDSLTVSYGRYSPQEMELLMALYKERKPHSGKILINEAKEKETKSKD